MKTKFIKLDHFKYDIKVEQLVDRDLLKKAINTFFNKKIEGQWTDSSHHLGVLVRVGTQEGIIVSLTNLVKINTGKEDKDFLLELTLNALEFKGDGYSDLVIDKVFFTFCIFTGKTEVNYKETKPNLFKKVKLANYSHYKFPIVIPSGVDQIYNYGNVITFSDSKLEEGQNINKTFSVQSSTNNLFYLVQHYGDDQNTLFNKVTVFKNSNVVMEFLDKYEVGASVWYRYISKREYAYNLNCELEFMSLNKYVSKRINSTSLQASWNHPTEVL